jgi:hypothetical protein
MERRSDDDVSVRQVAVQLRIRRLFVISDNKCVAT